MRHLISAGILSVALMTGNVASAEKPVTNISGSIPHPNGTLGASYQLENGKWKIAIDLPEKTTGNLPISEIDDSEQVSQINYTPQQGQIQAHQKTITVPDSLLQAQGVTLHFSTPLRLQQQGHPLGKEEINAKTMLMALIRRQSLLSEFHQGVVPEIEYSKLHEKAENMLYRHTLTWQDWKRYSSRQQQETPLSGLTGTWELKGDLSPFIHTLYLGQWSHIGKNATFGLGKYTLSITE